MNECIFCEIIKGNTPCYRIYENETAVAFLAPEQDVDGHMIVITKKHFENIFDCDCFTLNALMKTVKDISNHLIENCGYSGVNLLTANGKSAQQSVEHFHIHMIPRKDNDGLNAWPNMTSSQKSLAQMQALLKMR